MVRCEHALLLALGAISVLGCFPPVDISGKRCSPERTCGQGFHCVDGRCAEGEESARPANLVENPGFEEGVGGWVATGELAVDEPGFAGRRAARLVPGGSSGPVTLTPLAPPVPDAADDFYCATAWVRGGENQTATLEILEDGQARDDDPAPLVLQDSWQQLEAVSLFTGHEVATVRFTFSSAPAHPVWVDEVRFWRSDSPLCEDGP